MSDNLIKTGVIISELRDILIISEAKNKSTGVAHELNMIIRSSVHGNFLREKISILGVQVPVNADRGYTGTNPVQIAFGPFLILPTVYKFKWNELTAIISSIVYYVHGEKIVNDLLKIDGGNDRKYFSKKMSDLASPRVVIGSDVYVETNLSANNHVSLHKVLGKLFGLSYKIISK